MYIFVKVLSTIEKILFFQMCFDFRDLKTFVKHLMDQTDETTWIMKDMLFDAINLTLNTNNGEIIRSVIICDNSFPTKRYCYSNPPKNY